MELGSPVVGAIDKAWMVCNSIKAGVIAVTLRTVVLVVRQKKSGDARVGW